MSGTEISYRGVLDEHGVESVRQLLASDTEIETLAIASPGGELNLGMDLADLVVDHGLDVRVVGWGCASSCANYVFPAGRHKFVDSGAVVVWHGSALQKGLGGWWRVLPAMRAYARKVKARQRLFYERIGVDARVTILGQELGCRCLWTLRPLDMAKFGIRDVHVAPAYGERQPDWDRLRIRLIRLSQHPDYAATLPGAS